MKIILVVFGLIFLWWAFHRQESLLALFTFKVASETLGFFISILRGLFFGYLAYALVAVFGCIARISTFGDVLTILAARPSEVGGPGIVGVIFGALVGFLAFRGIQYGGYVPKIQGRTIRYQVVRLKVVRSVEKLLRRISK